MITIRSDLGEGTLPDRAWPELRAPIEKYAGPAPVETLRPKGTKNIHKRHAVTEAGEPVLLCAPEARGLNYEVLMMTTLDHRVTCPLCLAELGRC